MKPAPSVSELAAGNAATSLTDAVTLLAICITTSDDAKAHDQLQRIQKSDTTRNGAFTIRGKVHDANGKPVTGALIDIMGAFQFISCDGELIEGNVASASRMRLMRKRMTSGTATAISDGGPYPISLVWVIE